MTTNSEQIKGLVAINIAAIIFGSAALYGKLAISPFWIVCMRGLFATAALLCFAVIKKQFKKPTRSEVSDLAITGTILALHWLTFFFSVQLSGVAIATLTFSAFPIFTLIIEALNNARKIKPVELVAGIMIVVAVAILVKIDSAASHVVWGASSGLLSAVLFSVFGIMSKKLTNRLPAVTISFWQNLVVAIILLPVLPFSMPAPLETPDWLFLALLGIVTTAVMHQLYLFSLKRLTASTCSGFVALEPVYAIFFAALFFNEPVTFTVVVSGFLILLASFLLVWIERSEGKVYPVA